jgi:hypothetical protein
MSPLRRFILVEAMSEKLNGVLLALRSPASSALDIFAGGVLLKSNPNPRGIYFFGYLRAHGKNLHSVRRSWQDLLAGRPETQYDLRK